MSSRWPALRGTAIVDDATRRLVGWGAFFAAGLHTLTDALEWMMGGFSTTQLWLNYLAFLPLPAVMVGLYAAQRPHASRLGLAGALLYGFAFVYFAHTTLVALASDVPTYEELWGRLGSTYTVHGAVMVAGGFAFGWDAAHASVFPRWTAGLSLAGVALNLALALLPLPELLQTLGTVLRNAGLMGMGWALATTPRHLRSRAVDAPT